MYVVERESYSLVGCSMLDLFIFKHVCKDGLYSVRFAPHIKATSRHIPLTSESCHSLQCHRSWPLGEIGRMYSRSFSIQHFRAFQARKISRFELFFLCPAVLESCRAWAPRICVPKDPSLESTRARVIRLVLPFSRRWNGLSRKLVQLHADWAESLRYLGVVFTTQVSFSRGSKPLWAMARAS